MSRIGLSILASLSLCSYGPGEYFVGVVSKGIPSRFSLRASAASPADEVSTHMRTATAIVDNLTIMSNMDPHVRVRENEGETMREGETKREGGREGGERGRTRDSEREGESEIQRNRETRRQRGCARGAVFAPGYIAQLEGYFSEPKIPLVVLYALGAGWMQILRMC